MTHSDQHGGRLRAALFCLLLLVASAPASWAAGEVALRFVAWQDQGEQSLGGATDLLAAFSDRHPDIRVNFTHESWAQATVRLRYWCRSHRQYAPDLTVLPDVWLSEYADELLPLEDCLKPKDTAGFVPAVLDRCRVKGRLVGLPWIVRSRALYYRADLLEAAKLKPPQTLEQLKSAATALADVPQRFGLGLPAKPGGGALETFLDLLRAHGGQPADAGGKLDLKTKEAEAALAYWVGLRQAGALQPEGLSWTEGELQTAFIQGRLGAVIAGPELHQRLRAEAPTLQVEVAPLPTDHEASLPVSAEVLVALKSTQQPDQTINFLRFMASAEAQRAMSFMGSLPTYRAQYEAVRDAPDVRPFLAGLQRARGLPMQESDQAATIVERALALALSGRMTPADALKTAADEAARSVY